MKNFKLFFGALTSFYIIGIITAFSPFWGVDYSEKPDQIKYSTSNEKIEPNGSKNKYTWQVNFNLPKTNEKLDLAHTIFPLSICKKVTYTDKQTISSYQPTNNKKNLKDYVLKEIELKDSILNSLIRPGKNYIPQTNNCNSDINNKVVNTLITFKGLASDENPDRGFSSIFEEDEGNLKTASIREEKFKKILEKIQKENPNLQFKAENAEESKLTEDQVKTVLQKNFTFGSDEEREEILSAISLIDSGILKDVDLQNLLNLHRGVRINTVKDIQTEQLVTYPVPLGLTPLLLLVRSIRMTVFSFARVNIATFTYLVNRFVKLLIFLIKRLYLSVIYSSRVARIMLKRFAKYSIKQGKLNLRKGKASLYLAKKRGNVVRIQKTKEFKNNFFATLIASGISIGVMNAEMNTVLKNNSKKINYFLNGLPQKVINFMKTMFINPFGLFKKSKKFFDFTKKKGDNIKNSVSQKFENTLAFLIEKAFPNFYRAGIDKKIQIVLFNKMLVITSQYAKPNIPQPASKKLNIGVNVRGR